GRRRHRPGSRRRRDPSGVRSTHVRCGARRARAQGARDASPREATRRRAGATSEEASGVRHGARGPPLTAFLDTSALVKRYVEEPGSASVRRLLRRTSPAVGRVTYAELAAVIARAAREEVIDERYRDAILARLDGDFASFTVVEVRRATLRIVPVLVVHHG